MARVALGRGPALVLDNTGISIGTGLATVSRIAWTQVRALSVKASMLNSGLVIEVLEPGRLPGEANAYRRWQMNSTQRFYGSPIVVPTSFLKCDPEQLLASAEAFRTRYGGR
jgi:hypothetical protein